MPSLSLGLGLHKNRIFASEQNASPIPQSGLSLWLKADAGVNTAPQTFISQIVVSGAGTADSNGTYTRTSGGTSTFYKNGTPGGNNIYFEDGYESSGLNFYLYDYQNDTNTYIITIKKSEIIDSSIAGGDAPLPTFTTTLTATGNYEVNTWADQSGNSNNAIANATEEPTFVSSFLNGKPAIEFNGQGQVMQIADANSLDFLNTSCFIVLKYLGDGSGNDVIYIKNADDGSPADPAVYGMVGTLGLFNGNLDWPVSSAAQAWPDLDSYINIADGTPRLLSMTYDGTDIITYDAGVQTSSNELGGNMLTSTGLLQIGGYNLSFGASEYFNGQIAEIIMYNRAVSSTERQQVEAYLNTKYAIY